jgi:hypothetical protein
MGVTMTFEESKQRKLKRMSTLRIMNALGMVAWRDDGYGSAKQMLRMIHPLVWIWFSIMTIFGIFAQGIPDTYADIKDIWGNELVWF